jgi:hypothetical protein
MGLGEASIRAWRFFFALGQGGLGLGLGGEVHEGGFEFLELVVLVAHGLALALEDEEAAALVGQAEFGGHGAGGLGAAAQVVFELLAFFGLEQGAKVGADEARAVAAEQGGGDAVELEDSAARVQPEQAEGGAVEELGLGAGGLFVAVAGGEEFAVFEVEPGGAGL